MGQQRPDACSARAASARREGEGPPRAAAVPQQPKRALLRVSHWITGPEWEKMFDDQAAEKEAKKNAPKKPRGRPPKVPAGQAKAKGSRGKAKAKAAKEESSSSDDSDS